MKEKETLWMSKRLLLALIGFLGTMNLYSMRINLSVAIICMTNQTSENVIEVQTMNSTCVAEKDVQMQGGSLNWDKQTRGIILGVFFWGYVLTQIPAGLMVLRSSVKWLVFGFMLTASLSVLLMPLAANLGVGYVVVLRVICGLCSGVWFPCFHQLWSRWAPPAERSLLAGLTFTGLHVGNAVTLPVAGLLCKYGFGGGWPSIFYLCGIFGILWCILWGLLVFDTPELHPRISIKEKKYIQKSLIGQLDVHSPKFTDLPWKSIATSKPFWAIAIVNVAFDWNGYTFITSTPAYMKDVLKFNIAKNAFLSAAPYVGMWIGQIGFAVLCSYLQEKKILSVTKIRTMMNSIGMLTPALVIIILAYLTCESRYLAVVLLTFGLSATSSLFVGAFVNHVDIAPQYAGLLFGLTNTVGGLTGFFSSYFVGAVTNNNSINGWRIVFFVCSAIYIIGAVSYLFMGSGDLQPWAVHDTPAKDDEQLMKEKKLANDVEEVNGVMT